MARPTVRTLDELALARLAAAMWAGSGLLVLGTMPFLPLGPDANRPLGALVGAGALAVGIAVWFAPWERWHPRATLVLVPLALAMIALFNMTADNPWLYDTFFVVSLVWVGLAHPRGTSLASTPLLVAAYLLPLAGRSSFHLGAPSALFIIPICVLLGEAAAWVAVCLRRAEEATAASQARFAALVRHASEFVVILDDGGHVTYASPALETVLGFDPSSLLTRAPSQFVHPDDFPGVARHFGTVESTGATSPAFVYRVRHADGAWRWIEGTMSDLRGESAVGGIVMNGRDVTERVESAANLRRLARVDPLTDLPNRTAFLEHLDRAVAAARPGAAVAVLFVDLDGFKVVNDSLGHGVGDALLRSLGRRLAAVTPEAGCLARIGGDEFTILLTGLGDGHAAERSARRVLDALDAAIEIDGRSHCVRASVGISQLAEGPLPAEELLRQADLAQYRAKELGGGRYETFDEQLALRARRRLDLEGQLRTAIDGGEIVVHYQPEVELPTGRVIGAEALVRWAHPAQGLLPPAAFLDIAEATSLIVPLGDLVLATACADAVGWTDARLTVAVNVSAVQLRDPRFPASVRSHLEHSGLDASRLCLELTETALVDAGASEVLAELAAIGVTIALDDFGTGYSSLGYLDQLPIDVVKIDRSFIADVVDGNEEKPVVAAAIAMASSLRLGVVAEGVEGPAHVELLHRLGCRRAQGYHFGRPVPAAAFAALVADHPVLPPVARPVVRT